MNNYLLPLIIALSASLYYMIHNRLAIFFPSFSPMIRIILEIGDFKKNDLIYDLGSGDGRILFALAKRGFNCVGIEKNWILNLIARKRLKGYKNVKIIEGDIFKQDLSKATVLIAYLSRFLTRDLEKKVLKECKKGTRVILLSYKFYGIKPFREKKWMWLPITLYVV